MGTDDTTTHAEEQGQEARLDRLEERQEEQGQVLARIEALLSKGTVSPTHATAEKQTEARLDRATSISEEVKAELAKAKAEEQARADADAEKSEREQMKIELAKLRETPPAPPRKRSTVLLGWGDGR